MIFRSPLPVSGLHFDVCSEVEVTADVTVNSGSVKQCNFYRNGSRVTLDRRAPYSATLKNLGSGYHEMIVGAVGSDDVEVFSDPIYFVVGDWTQGNRIINGTFDCILTPWRLGNYESGVGTASVDPEAEIDEGGAALVEISNPGTLYWHIQLYQDFPILAGHTYEVYFIAEVPDDKEIYVAFQMDHDPYTNYLEEPVELIGNNAYGPITLESAVDDPSVEFKFMVGGNDVPVYFDDVMILDLNMDPVTSVDKQSAILPDNQLLTGSYPNPFNGQTKIFYHLPAASEVRIQLLNIQGEAVREWQQGMQSAGDHFIHWDGLNQAGQSMPSGLYLYRIQAVNPAASFQAARRLQLIQ